MPYPHRGKKKEEKNTTTTTTPKKPHTKRRDTHNKTNTPHHSSSPLARKADENDPDKRVPYTQAEEHGPTQMDDNNTTCRSGTGQEDVTVIRI